MRASSLASFLVEVKTIARPCCPLYTWGVRMGSEGGGEEGGGVHEGVTKRVTGRMKVEGV